MKICLYYDINLNDTASFRPHKMGMFYFQLMLSKDRILKLKFLVAVVNASDIETYGIDAVLEEIVCDLETLESGVEGPNGIIFAGLYTFIGDNLAAHTVGGFKCSFVAKHCCLYCKVPTELLRTLVSEDPSLLRTKEEYDAQVAQLDAAESVAERDELSMNFGINRGCILNRLKSYHVIGGMPPDSAHDILEGAFPLVVKNLLHHFCVSDQKVMSLNDFNCHLKEFGYFFSDAPPKDFKPQHLTDKENLHQTASQMWTLAVILPFILGPKITEENEHWNNFLLLLEVSAIVHGYSASPGIINYLSVVIEEFLESFKSLYRSFIPKLHF